MLNYSPTQLSIEELAKISQLSLFSFKREFKKEFYDSPKNYINTLRIKKAKELLQINGVWIPFTQTAQLQEPKDDINDFIHQLTIHKFEWDKFPISAIKPFKDVNAMGDDKPFK